MRPERRSVAMVFFPGSNRVVYQPLGVIGIVSPWNYPVSLALAPLAMALAAGNRVMLKPSELTPTTSALLAAMLSKLFTEERVAVVIGDAKIGKCLFNRFRPYSLHGQHSRGRPSCAPRAKIWCESRSSSAASRR